MGSKTYAVRRGRRTGLFATWDECRAQVTGFAGAEFKSFPTREQAEAYLGEAPSEVLVTGDSPPSPVAGEMIAYVDGSFDAKTRVYGAGAIVYWEGGVERIRRSGADPDLAAMHNVAGEILAAMAAVEFAKAHGARRIVIHHDYEGIARWPRGDWKTGRPGTKAYAEAMREAGASLKIEFAKVLAHSGNTWNDEADRLAKEAVAEGISRI